MSHKCSANGKDLFGIVIISSQALGRDVWEYLFGKESYRVYSAASGMIPCRSLFLFLILCLGLKAFCFFYVVFYPIGFRAQIFEDFIGFFFID